MKGANLRRLYENLGPRECVARLTEGLKRGLIRSEDFSLRELAESFCGHEWVNRLNPRNLRQYSTVNLTEAGEGTDVSAFSNITGQIFFNKIMEGWTLATRVSDQLVTTIGTKLDGEKMPWIGHLPTEGEGLRPGQPYPEASFGERYIETPSTTKYGAIVSVTKEAIFFDLTGQMMRAAQEVGEKLGYNKEKRVLKVVLGIVNNYKLNGTSLNTYLTSGGWINTASSWPLVDWTSIEKAYIQASQITDPDSSLPIQIDLKQLFVMPAKRFTAERIMGATEVETVYPGYGASSPSAPGNVKMSTKNPIPTVPVLTSPIAHQLLVASGVSSANASDYWYIGDFKKAFAYMENWPMSVVQAPANNAKEFEQDIVVRYKASERGAAAVIDPRYVFKYYNS